MERLPFDTLAHIVSMVSDSELQSLRATNSLLEDVIIKAPVALRPRRTIAMEGLFDVAWAFPCATSLDLTQCSELKYLELSRLPQLFPRLAAVSLRGLLIEHIPMALLSCLESLSMYQCVSFSRMVAIRDMTSLRSLALIGCGMASLPAGLGLLSQLESLSLITSPRLAAIPDAILASLKQLKILDLTSCTLLTGLPDSTGGLLLLEVLKLSECSSLTVLPDNIGSLSKLGVLDVTHCSSLARLPYSIGDLSQLKVNLLTSHRSSHIKLLSSYSS